MSTWYDAGRRIGLHTAIAQLTARKQQLFEIYNAAQIERICDIYDIKYRETEACLAIVQQILEAKVSDTYQGPTANQPKKCPLPRIGSKEWGWESHYGQGNKPWWSSPHNEYQVDWINGRWGVMGDGDVANMDALCRASCDNLDVAFRIAELLARRDWRKEQGKR